MTDPTRARNAFAQEVQPLPPGDSMHINGKPVICATEPLLFEITEDDILDGGVKDPGACAVARAIIRTYGVRAARVHLRVTYLEHADHWVRYYTSANIRAELVAFDRDGRFMPGKFRLSPPPPGQTPAGRKEWAERRRKEGKAAAYSREYRRRQKAGKPKRTYELLGIRPRGANR